MRSKLVAVVAALLAAMFSWSAAPAQAGSGSDPVGTSCVAYATGSGMGSYCNTAGGGGGPVYDLNQLYPGMAFQPCKYETPPSWVNLPIERNNGGDWWWRVCLNGVDLNTPSGGNNKKLSMQLVWLEDSFDTTYEDNALSDLLWQQAAADTQFPVPYARPKPTTSPVVGSRAFFEFGWVDPETNKPMQQGPYANAEYGGPFAELKNGAMEMKAEPSNINLDPQQTDMEDVDCGPGNPEYDTSIDANHQLEQKSPCFLRFARSSASARQFATADGEIPGPIVDAYYIKVTVTWDVQHRENGGRWERLGNGEGYDMVSYQPLSVLETQGNNILPEIIQ